MNPMWSISRCRSLSCSPATQQWKLGLSMLNRTLSFSSSATDEGIRSGELLKLEEVETILRDVKADNVKVIPIPKHCDFADFMVVATGRSAWHVRNIAQALIYKAGSVTIVATSYVSITFTFVSHFFNTWLS